MVIINQSIVLIALPDIFRGIGLNPLHPANTGYLLWMLMGFLVVMAVLRRQPRPGRRHVRPGADVQPRLRRLHRLLDPARRSPGWTAPSGAIWLIVMRVGQGVGGRHALRQLVGHPHRRLPAEPAGPRRSASTASPRSPARSSASCSAACSPRSSGTWSSWSRSPSGSSAPSGPTSGSQDTACGPRPRSTGGATSPSPPGSSLILVGITYGLQPYGGHTMGWTSPFVLGRHLIGGVAVLVVFGVIETTRRRPDVPAPPRSASAPSPRATWPSFMAALSRGGLHVHADHLAPGDLAAAARLQLRADAACGRASTCSRSPPGSSSPARWAASWPTATAPGPSPPAGCSLVALSLRSRSRRSRSTSPTRCSPR